MSGSGSERYSVELVEENGEEYIHIRDDTLYEPGPVLVQLEKEKALNIAAEIGRRFA